MHIQSRASEELQTTLSWEESGSKNVWTGHPGQSSTQAEQVIFPRNNPTDSFLSKVGFGVHAAATPVEGAALQRFALLFEVNLPSARLGSLRFQKYSATSFPTE